MQDNNEKGFEETLMFTETSVETTAKASGETAAEESEEAAAKASGETAAEESEEAAAEASGEAAAEESEETTAEAEPDFASLGLNDLLCRAIREMGFDAPSPIQEQAIPPALAGQDLIGQAQTGTGKTAAFGLPILERIRPGVRSPQAVILCPTRELAIQVSDELHRYAKYLHGVRILPVYGGQDISRQIRGLREGAHVIVGTPGRVMDHMRRKTICLDNVRFAVLDEADEMLNMGFLEDMETILAGLPEERQTVMFSATMPPEIRQIAERFLKEPVLLRMAKKELTVPEITQYYYDVRPNKKTEVLCRLLDLYEPKLAVVFCNTKRRVDELVEELQGRGLFAEGLHGDLNQAQRDRVMKAFRSGRTDILVATDVVARGIDVEDIEAVFNYDIPQDDEYYVHRIGRTGRAGRTGTAYSFVVGREVYKLREIQRYCKTKILPQALPSLGDLTERKADRVLDRALERISSEDGLEKYRDILDRRIFEDEVSSMDFAAALLAMALGRIEEVDLSREEQLPRSLDDLDKYRRGGRDAGSGRYGRGKWQEEGSRRRRDSVAEGYGRGKWQDDGRRRKGGLDADTVEAGRTGRGKDGEKRFDADSRRDGAEGYGLDSRREGVRKSLAGKRLKVHRRGEIESGMVRLFINVGKKQNVRPADIVGAIAGEAGISGRMVGSIDMKDSYSFVDVDRQYADRVLKAMRKATIRGMNVHMEKAEG